MAFGVKAMFAWSGLVRQSIGGRGEYVGDGGGATNEGGCSIV